VAGASRVALYKYMGALAEALPESLDVAVGRRAATFVGRRTAGPRARLKSNLARALYAPGERADPALLERFADRAFDAYGRYWGEGAKLPAIPAATIVERFVVAEGREHLEAAKAAGRGLIIALPHVGSWEWGGAYLAQVGLAMTAVAEVLEPPALFEWFCAKRAAMGITVTPLDDHAGTTMLTTLRAGGVVGLLVDRDIVGTGIGVDFFGERVTMPAGPATLALRTGAALVAAACYSGPGDGHHAVVVPVDAQRRAGLREDVARVTQELATELEGLIRRAPEQWHVLEDRFAPT
jgi:phosphatidylinositol dimannoside acyltransferase